MIKRTTPNEHAALLAMSAATGVFYDNEIETLEEVLADFEREGDDYGHFCQTLLQNEEPIGFAYYAPVAMADRTWELWWIVVAPKLHGQGIGTQILHAVEAEIRNQEGRLLLIETSSLPKYEPTRRFYLKHGYVEVARVPHFYRNGDDKVIYSRLMSGAVDVS